MLHTIWSVKGGSGVTVVSATLAAMLARREGRATLVDLCGDQPAALGLAEPSGPGICDWLATDDGSSGQLARLGLDVGDGLSLLSVGTASSWRRARHAELAAALGDLRHPVVIDAGVLGGDTPASGEAPSSGGLAALGSELAGAGRSTMVIRPCYLALRRAVSSRCPADAVIVVTDIGRALDRNDVSKVLGLPVVASVEVDPSIARSVDAGLLVRRTHRSFERALRGAT